MTQNTQDYMISPRNYESSKRNCHTFRVVRMRAVSLKMADTYARQNVWSIIGVVRSCCKIQTHHSIKQTRYHTRTLKYQLYLQNMKEISLIPSLFILIIQKKKNIVTLIQLYFIYTINNRQGRSIFFNYKINLE